MKESNGFFKRNCRKLLTQLHKDVHLCVGDKNGIENVAQYISRCPFSLARMIKVTPEGNVLYRSEHNEPKNFPHWKSIPTLPGINRNFEVFKPLDFLAQMTQHIPDRYQNLTMYFGWYSCRSRGVRKKAESLDSHKDFTKIFYLFFSLCLRASVVALHIDLHDSVYLEGLLSF